METTGQIKAVSDQGDRYGIQIDGVWYNGFGTLPAQKGDNVKVIYKVTESNGRKFQNITKIEKTDKKTDRQTGIEETARLRRKTDCLRMAIDLVLSGQIKPEKENIQEMAKNLFDWVESDSTSFLGIKVEKVNDSGNIN